MSSESPAREVWERFGSGYDRAFFSVSTAVAEEALRFADVRPGMTLLDVAAGSGALSIPACRLGARVLATDLSPTMLAILKGRAANEGLIDVRTRVMDGTALEVRDGAFERVCSQFGVMFFPDPGLREMYRATSPGGRGVAIIFGRPEHVPMSLFGLALARALPEADLPPDPSLLSEPTSLKPMMEAAGFLDVTLHTHQETLPLASVEELWEWMRAAAPGFATFVEMLPNGQRSRVHDALLEVATERYGDDFAQPAMEVIIGSGSKA